MRHYMESNSNTLIHDGANVIMTDETLAIHGVIIYHPRTVNKCDHN